MRNHGGKPTGFSSWALILLLCLAGCSGGDSDNNRPPIELDPPITDLVWDQGNWDELNWQ